MEKEKPRKRKKVLLIILITCVIGVVALTTFGFIMRWWSFGNNLIKINTMIETNSKVKEFPLAYGTQNNLVCAGGFIVLENEGFLEWRDQLGTVVKKSETKMNAPMIKGNRDYIVVAENKGRKIEVYNKQSLLWKAEIDENILNVDVNQNGFVCLVRSYAGYRSAVEVYNETGTKLFSAFRANNLIKNAFVLPNNKTTVVNSMNTNGCALETLVEYLGQDGKKINQLSYDNAMILKAQGLNDEQTFLASAKQVILVGGNGKQLFKRNYGMVQSVSTYNADMLAISAIPQVANASVPRNIEFVNSRNEIQNTLEFPSSIKSMIAMEDAVIVNLGRKVIVLNRHGQILGGTVLNSEVMGIRFLEKGKALVTLSDRAVICSY
ncbi:MAG: DUF5711 family protein [Clostridia bacterium]